MNYVVGNLSKLAAAVLTNNVIKAVIISLPQNDLSPL